MLLLSIIPFWKLFVDSCLNTWVSGCPWYSSIIAPMPALAARSFEDSFLTTASFTTLLIDLRV